MAVGVWQKDELLWNAIYWRLTMQVFAKMVKEL